MQASPRNPIIRGNARRASPSIQSRGRGQIRRSRSLAGKESVPPPYMPSRRARSYYAGIHRYQKYPAYIEPEHSVPRNSRAAPTRGNFPNAMGCNQWVPIEFPQYVGWGAYRAGELGTGELGYRAQLGGRGARMGSFTRGTWSNAGRGVHFRHAGYGRNGTISQQSPMSFNRGTRWTLESTYTPWDVFDDVWPSLTTPSLDNQQRANPAPP